ncbi:MAG: PhoH family protein, partial [Sphingobium sp.]
MSRKPVPAQSGDRSRIEVVFDRPQLLGALFGQYDQNLVAIENRLGVYILARGNKIQIEGEASVAARARDVLTGLYNRIVQGQDIDSGVVEAVIGMSAEPTLDGIIRHDVSTPPSIMIRTRMKTIVPRTVTQGVYMEALARDDIIFALGPAGTGKT